MLGHTLMYFSIVVSTKGEFLHLSPSEINPSTVSLEVIFSLWVLKNLPYPQLPQGFSPKTSHKCPCSHLYTFMTQPTPTHHELPIVTALSWWPLIQTGKMPSLSEMGAKQVKRLFSQPVCARGREIGYLVPTKVSDPRHCHAVCTLLQPSTSPCSTHTIPISKDIAGRDITRWKFHAIYTM